MNIKKETLSQREKEREKNEYTPHAPKEGK